MSVSSANEVVHRLRHLREVLVAVEQLPVCMGEPFVSAFTTALAERTTSKETRVEEGFEGEAVHVRRAGRSVGGGGGDADCGATRALAAGNECGRGR